MGKTDATVKYRDQLCKGKMESKVVTKNEEIPQSKGAESQIKNNAFE